MSSNLMDAIVFVIRKFFFLLICFHLHNFFSVLNMEYQYINSYKALMHKVSKIVETATIWTIFVKNLG
jgi:hypothetical protein